MKTYQAKATREGKWWAVEIPELGQFTQGRNVVEADAMARDLIALYEDIPAGSFDVAMEYEIPINASAHIAKAEQLRSEAARANSAAAAEARLAAAELRAEGLGLKDIGRVMGVSFQRAGQLVNAGDRD